MAYPDSSSGWDLASIQQLVADNDLESARIEYKRELGNGAKVLEAIAALANTFGGIVLVGVDEGQPPGPARLTGVPGGDRDRLSRMCWDRLVPPFGPEIIPVPLTQADTYVLVVAVDPYNATRPVMVSQGNRFLVRIEGHNVPADWYRLRELFAEVSSVPDRARQTGRSIVQQQPPDLDGDPPLAFGIRGELWLAGPRGQANYVTDVSRSAVLDAFDRADCPLTAPDRALSSLVHDWTNYHWHPSGWRLDGRQTSRRISARWHAVTADGRRRLAETRLVADLSHGAGRHANLNVQLDALLPSLSDPTIAATLPYLDLGILGRIILDLTGTLWGSAGEALSQAILGQPLGPPAELAVSLGCLGEPGHRIDEFIRFGSATLVPGNTPGDRQEFDEITPDRGFLSATSQRAAIREWLIQLGINHGYRDVEGEVSARLDS